MGENMADLKDIISNIENIYGSTNSLNLLKDFERVVDELDIYVYDNWIDGELVAGPKESRYFIECTFMWPEDKMPDPTGGKKLLEYGCTVKYAESHMTKVRKIKDPDDIRPGTKKGKIDREPIWMVKIKMPKKLMADINRGHRNLDANKVQDIVNQNGIAQSQEDAGETQVQDATNV
jgi:hypothetical protein